eukprot:INCI2964.1.p1 GENE.INCI2964.1~~INCI2964.1.p1  ORF type:complete len:415 (-),score=73.56 INCI2964.1:162-1406(-)
MSLLRDIHRAARKRRPRSAGSDLSWPAKIRATIFCLTTRKVLDFAPAVAERMTKACQVLCTAMAAAPSNVTCSLANGAPESVVTVLQFALRSKPQYGSSVGVAEALICEACRALKALASTDGGAAACGDAGAVKCVTATLRQHVRWNANHSSESFQCSATTLDSCFLGDDTGTSPAALLHIHGAASGNKTRCAYNGEIRAAIVIHALGCLWNLMANNPQNKRACVENGALEASIAVLEEAECGANPAAVELASGALRKFAAFPGQDYKLRCLEAGAVAVLTATLIAHMKEPLVVHYSCATLADLVQYASPVSVATSAGPGPAGVHDVNQQERAPKSKNDSAVAAPGFNPAARPIPKKLRLHLGLLQAESTLRILQAALPVHAQHPKAAVEIKRLLDTVAGMPLQKRHPSGDCEP